MGYYPRSLFEIEDKIAPINEAMGKHIETIKTAQDKAMQNLHLALKIQQKYYDMKHQPKEFAISDKVLLSNKNLKTWQPNKKLDGWFSGPLEIIERVGR
jgi:hypothetical protein